MCSFLAKGQTQKGSSERRLRGPGSATRKNANSFAGRKGSFKKLLKGAKALEQQQDSCTLQGQEQGLAVESAKSATLRNS